MSAITPGFNEIWRYEGWTTASEAAYAGALDSDGNVILAGQQGFEATSGTGSDDTFINSIAGDFAAVKLFGESGDVAWIWVDQSTGSSGYQVEAMFGADTDSNNDVILGGFTTGSWLNSNENGVRHLAAVKLDGSTGDEIWRFQEVAQDGPGTVGGVAVDGDDNVFLVGGTYSSLVDDEGDPEDYDYFMVKVSGATGNAIFTVQGGLSYHYDSIYDAKVDSAGDVVVVGKSGFEDRLDFLVLKLSGTDGSVLWEYSPSSETIDVLHAVDIDEQDNVYVAGGEDAQNLLGDITESPLVIKLSGTNGTVEWTYSSTSTSRTIFRSVAVDPTMGWVVGAGYTEGTWLAGEARGGYDFAATVLDSDSGEELARYQNGTDGLYCCRIRCTQGKTDASGWSLRTIVPASGFEPRPQQNSLPSRRLPAYKSAIIEFDDTGSFLPPPSPVTHSPLPLRIDNPPAAATVEAKESPPPYRDIPPAETQSSAPAENPWQGLGWSLRTIVPASGFGPRPQQNYLPSRRLPAYKSAILEFDDTVDSLPPPSQVTHSPLPFLIDNPPAAYTSPLPPSEEPMSAVTVGAKDIPPVETQSPASAAKSWQILGWPRRTIVPASGFGPRPQQNALPSRRLPAYKSAILEFDDTVGSLPPPSQVTHSPLPLLIDNPPAAYTSPLPPPEEPMSAVTVGAKESPPPYKDIPPVETQSPAPAEKPWQRLAKRMNHVSSKNRTWQQSYLENPIRLYGPYAPAP